MEYGTILTKEEDFKKIEQGTGAEVVLKSGAIVTGKLLDNISSNLHIEEALIDTTIRYDQIRSIRIIL